MDQEFKAKWLKALTDGSYKHTTGNLKNDNGHCCLGVAAELYGYTITNDGYDVKEECRDGADGHEFYLPGPMSRKLGLTAEHQKKLADLNDAEQSPNFPQTVIDYITAL